MKLVLFKCPLIHAVFEVELTFTSSDSLDEIALINDPIWHALFTIAMRKVVPPVSLNKPSIRGDQLPLTRGCPICHLALIHTPIMECHLYLLTFCQVAQEKLASESGAILPGNFPAIVGLSLDCPSRVSHSPLDLDNLDAALHRQRTPHLPPCADIQVFLFGEWWGVRKRR